jgi:3-deoxy-D-manno-octulosonic-acid transferase
VHPGELFYEAAVRAAPAALRLAAPFHAKLRRGLEGRRTSLDSLLEWAEHHRPDDIPLVWLHAPSVGEALMAQAILGAVRDQAPATLAVFTYFSPSAERMAARVGADWAGYLPWDHRGAMRAAVHALRPAAVAFIRTEIWPVLGREARALGGRVVLVNAVLSEHSSRMGAVARMILGPAYRRLDAVGVVTAADIGRFQQLGVSYSRIAVTGDARFDQVWSRVQSLDRRRPLLRALERAAGPRLVAGSTWEPDEAAVVEALAAARHGGAEWRLIIAPHEPTDAHVARLERLLERHALTHARLPSMDAADAPDVHAIIVDRVGVLADLYAVADAAWVGGGFGDAGLHSVVEPAALGVPVLYGPRHGHAREAGLLADAGGGFIVRDAHQLTGLLGTLSRDELRRRRAGAAARSFVAEHVGGAARNAGLILGTLDPAARHASDR